MKKYINTKKFDVIKMWDDSTPNLDMIIKLGHKYGIRTETYVVDPTTGNFTRHDNATITSGTRYSN